MKILTRGNLIDMDPNESEANAGAELDRRFPSESGFGSTYSELGFWKPEMMAAVLKAQMEQEQGRRQAVTARQVAQTNAGGHEQAALYNALAGLYGHGITAESARYAADQGVQKGVQQQQLQNQGMRDIAGLNAETRKEVARINEKQMQAEMFNAAVKRAQKERPGIPEDQATARALEIMGRSRPGTAPTSSAPPGALPPGGGLLDRLGPQARSLAESSAKGAAWMNPGYAMLQALPYITQYMMRQSGADRGGE